MKPGFWELFWRYLNNNTDTILTALTEHIWLSLVPVVAGFAIALPFGYLAHRYKWAYPPLLGLAGVLYTIPSLAMFVALPTLIGTRILDPLNIVIALTLYTAALLVRTIADGLNEVPEDISRAADAMGFSRLRRFFQVDLPVALPVIFSGLRVATVSNVSLVNVGALIGIGGLGELMTDGYYRDFSVPIIIAVVLSLLLAMVADLLVVLLQRVLTPWETRPRKRSSRRTAVRA